MDINELPLPANQRATLSRFLAACREDERIVAAFLGGSYARNEADKFSDLDLYFVTTDEAYADFLVEKETFARRLGEPLFLEDFGMPHGYLFILADATEGEFWFGRQSQFVDIHDGPFTVLFDSANVLSSVDFAVPVPDQSARIELLRRQIDLFWHELSHFIKAMGRGKLWFAHGQIEALRRICVVLARLEHDFLDAYLDADEPYFKIEQALPVEKLASLQATFCSADYDSMLEAGQILCRFYLDLAPGLARAHNLPYQIDLERLLMRQLVGLH